MTKNPISMIQGAWAFAFARDASLRQPPDRDTIQCWYRDHGVELVKRAIFLAVIYRIDNPSCSKEELVELVTNSLDKFRIKIAGEQ